MAPDTRATVVAESDSSQSLAEIYEIAGGEVFVIEIPAVGLKPSDIRIEADSSSLTVLMNPKKAARLFEFPADVDTDRVRATLKDGKLTIRAPKAAAAPLRVVPVEEEEPRANG